MFLGTEVYKDRDFDGKTYKTIYAKLYSKKTRGFSSSMEVAKPKKQASPLQLLNLAKGRAKKSGDIAKIITS